MLSVLLTILVILVICGAIAFLLNRAPFVEEPFKSFGVWVILVVAVIMIILVLAPLVGVHLSTL
jgi:uncharacterized membrane protein YdjX (TVP38/TMEM64 family)